MLNYSKYSPLNVSRLIKKIESADSIFLTTHRQCDGDGLGAILGLYHALKKTGKSVQVMTVDEVPKKYDFLQPLNYLDVFEENPEKLHKCDLALIFDTNDSRMVAPLFDQIRLNAKEVLFVDHHPILNEGPEPTPGSFIDTRAASTGEISFSIIKEMKIRIDEAIARSLYTSICFDTQLFKFIKNSPASHLIAAELIEHLSDPTEIHRQLFSTHTIDKVAFLSIALSEIEYFGEKTIAVLKIRAQDLLDHHLDMDDTRDVIDMLMNVKSLQAAALFREDRKNEYKLSLRSKGKMEVLGVAEAMGGGGHLYASGATLEGSYEDLKDQVVKLLVGRLDQPIAANG